MKTLYITRKNEKVVLEEHLSESRPFVLMTKPFFGQREIEVLLPKEGKLQGIAWCRHPQTGSFSAPCFFTSCKNVESAEMILMTSKGGYTLFLPLSSMGIATFLKGGDIKSLRVVASHSQKKGSPASPCLVVVEGRDLHQTLNLGFRMALELSQGTGKVLSEKVSLPSWMRRVGWSSGPSFGADIGHDAILKAIWSLRQTGCVPGFALLEEGWQDVSINSTSAFGGASLHSFEADLQKFPIGLKSLVQELHRAGVEKVGVWHTLLGYRGGIHPDLATSFGIHKNEHGQYLLGEDLGSTFQFFHNYYAALAKCGVDFVVVGDQSSLEQYFPDPDERRRRYQNLHAAIQAAAGVHFSSAPWHCECLRSDNLYWWNTSSVARIGKSDGESWDEVCRLIQDHLYNALWLKELMRPTGCGWNSNSPHAKVLALFWSLFGSPIILSDCPGSHQLDLIRRIVLPGGHAAAAQGIPELIEGGFLTDPQEKPVLCIAQNRIGAGRVVGAFNLYKKKGEIKGSVSFLGSKENRFLAWSAEKGMRGIFSGEDRYEFSLAAQSADLVTFLPVIDQVCLIGTPTLFLPSSTIHDVHLEEEEISFSMYVTGPVALYANRPILEVRRGGKVVAWDWDRKSGILVIEPALSIVGLVANYHVTFEW